MNRQRKLDNNIGNDTHVRDHAGNKFSEQNHSSTQMIIGEVLLPESEPIFRQNMVTVKLARGGRITSVAYPGAFIDPITGNLHGSYEGPIPGQMVAVGFENGNMNAPFVVNRYPYQGSGNTLVEQSYINPLTKAGFHAFDVMMGHFSGSFLSFNTGIVPSVAVPGSVTLNSVTDFDLNSGSNILLESLISAELKSEIVKITGNTHIELNGNTNFAVKYNELKTAFDLLKTELNNFITVFNIHSHTGVTSGGSSSGPSSSPGTPATADISASQNAKVLM